MELHLINYLFLNNELPLVGIGLLKIKYQPAYIENNFLIPANQFIQLLELENAQIISLINYIAENEKISKENAHLLYNSYINNNFIISTNNEINMLGVGSFYKNNKNSWFFEQKLLDNFLLDPIKLSTIKTLENDLENNPNNWILIAQIIAVLSIISILVRFYFL